MPCYYTGTREGDMELSRNEAQEKVTKLAQLLCEAVKYINWPEYANSVSNELQDWIKQHADVDAKRKRNHCLW